MVWWVCRAVMGRRRLTIGVPGSREGGKLGHRDMGRVCNTSREMGWRPGQGLTRCGGGWGNFATVVTGRVHAGSDGAVLAAEVRWRWDRKTDAKWSMDIFCTLSHRTSTCACGPAAGTATGSRDFAQ